MNRSISISTEVFAAIWAARQFGEESEDTILRRLLGRPSNEALDNSSTVSLTAGPGLRDYRNGVEFPEGFEIFRTYKRREYKAKALNGKWIRLDNNKQYATLNQLNSSIVIGAENVWNGNWKFRNPDGSIHSISELRQHAK